MSYYFAASLPLSFEESVARAKAALQEEGFGILTEIDVADTMKRKLGAEFRPYRILGACNPALAHQALLAEDKIGTMLPCNVVVQQLASGAVEIAAVDPVASMQAVDNPALGEVASEVQMKLRRVIESLRDA
jgi:uncharacterized protein (DUF302 family)